MIRPLCVYHSNCADGFGAAWVVRKALDGELDFHAAVHSDPPPDVRGRIVVMVDFAYPREVMLRLAAQARGVVVLDHHKSAAEALAADGNYIVDLRKYTGTVDWRRYLDNFEQDAMEGTPYARIYTLFDMHRSGIGITWDFFFPNVERPALLNRIEDRDLWLFVYGDTRAVQACLFSYPYDFATWDLLFRMDLEVLAIDGAAIERKHFKDIDELLRVVTRMMVIGGHTVPVANLPYTLTSDAGSKLAETHPFAACYWDTPAGRVFSLRSRPEGIDVSEIARLYGGGGHRNASGFRVTFDVARGFEVA